MLAVLLVSSSMIFAPAPVYRERPLTPKEREALLAQALHEMASAAAEARKMNYGTKAEWAEHSKWYKSKNRSAGEKLSRVHAGLPAGPMRLRVAGKAAEAWGNAGDDAKALRYYKDAAEQSPDADGRVRALWGVRICYLRLGKMDEGEKATKRMLKEAEALGEARSREWKIWLRQEERMREMERRLK